MFSNRLRRFARPASRRIRRRMGVAALLLCGLGTPIGLSLRAAHAQDATLAAHAGANGRVDAPMAVEWKFTGTPFTGNIAAPAVSEDTAYFASGGIVYAVDLTSGAQKWRYPAVGSLPTAILYTPTYSNGALFLTTGEGLTALDAATGKLKYPSFVVPNGATTSPLAVGDSVYFGGGNGRIFALNAKTGDPVNATFRSGVNLQTDISGNMTTDNGMLYVITANQVMHAVDALTGTQRWGVRLEGETRGAIAVPAGETLYVAVGSALQAFRASSGLPRWAIGTPRPITAPPVVDSDGTAYIVTADRAVYAITGKNIRAESVWKKTIPLVDSNVIAQPVIADDLLIIATQGGGLWAFDRATGALRWNYLLHPSATENQPLPLRAGVSAHPITVGDTLYALSDDGTLTAFRHNAEDVTPPMITPIRPAQGDYVNGQPPFTIRARVMDEGSGLNLETMSVKMDDNPIPLQRIVGVGTNGFLFDNATGELQYTIYPRGASEVGRSTALADGHHTVTISAKDWLGNATTRTWSFAVDDTIKRGGTGTQQPGGGRPGIGGFPGRGGGGGGKGGG